MSENSIQYEHFPNAPIVEAILSIGCEAVGEVDEDHVERFFESVEAEYPHRGEGVGFSGKIEVSPAARAVSQTVEQRRIGYEFRAANDAAIIRVSTAGAFSYHHLARYPGWDEFRARAHAAWSMYLDVFEPPRVNRIGLRFLDRIELPLPFTDLKEYLLTYPEVAPSIDTGFAGYLLRLVLPNDEIPAVGWITQAIEPVREDRGVVPLIFDVDVAREASLPVDEELVWGTLDRLRDYKNRLFFASITEKAKELFR